MLTLEMKNYKETAEIFKEKYKQNLLDAISQKQSELGIIYPFLSGLFLDKLLLYAPKKQYKLIRIVLKKFSVLNDNESDEIKALKYIFIEQGYNNLDKKEFYNSLQINSCIYCNRNYIFNLNENGHIKGHIDHFYDKATYPFLAMSFYNLIPSCETCNKVKSTYNTYENRSINPYVRIEQKLFDVNIISTDAFGYKLREDNLLEKLYIEKIYNDGHKDILNDIYNKFYQEETKEHFRLLKKEFSLLNLSEDEIHRYLTCGYLNKDEFHKRTFSKLIKDISEELELI